MSYTIWFILQEGHSDNCGQRAWGLKSEWRWNQEAVTVVKMRGGSGYNQDDAPEPVSFQKQLGGRANATFWLDQGDAKRE